MNSLLGRVVKTGVLFFAGMFTKGLMERKRRLRIMGAEESRRNTAAIFALQGFAFEYRQRSIPGDKEMLGQVAVRESEIYAKVATELQDKANSLKGRE